MGTINVDILLVIAVISAITQGIKKYLLQEHYKYASFVALSLGFVYVFAQKYICNQYQNINIVDTIVLSLAIGFAASGGYENIKNLFLQKK
ncbi:hypothetical protein A2335_03370 [Candidatus Peregrinibacteria bacterium RIFOXYB2_FULL_32_7]|nr:MAG: hypothetical protein A2335_03370 [Candidatus Peregrinibacteria bacterium RIFOXYB2_FULL_32_7]